MSDNENILSFEDAKKKKDEIRELENAIQEYIKEHPELAEYQAKIDDTLSKAGSNPHNRMLAFKALFQEQKDKLKVALDDLKTNLITFKNAIEVAQKAKEEEEKKPC